MPLRVHKKKLTNSTPFCKICFDAGKPESQYTSHFVKDSPGPNGKVVCPYLLTLNCRYCKENGHTISHCPLLQKKKAYSTVCSPSIPKQEARETQKIVTVAPKKPATVDIDIDIDFDIDINININVNINININIHINIPIRITAR